MRTPEQVLQWIHKAWKKEYTLAFFVTVLMGLLIHMPVMVQDLPNHDGLDSLYFDQNMITSGRWFLTIACGISSYFNLPWLISLLSLLYLGLASVCLTEILQLRSKVSIFVVSGLLISFPALACSFAYVFTLDGYMLALLLSIMAVWIAQRGKYGYLIGAVCLGCSMGIYQAYLPISILLCLYLTARALIEEDSIKGVWRKVFPLLKMGVLGVVFYFVLLYFLLFLQGKELASYQGINGEGAAGQGLLTSFKLVYQDFFTFLMKGKVLFHNGASAAAGLVLGGMFLWTIFLLARQKGRYKKPLFYLVLLGYAVLLPLVVNYILILSGALNYHMIMRYQWVFLLILVIALADQYAGNIAQWAILVAGTVLIFSYAVMDNIGYQNLHQKYEKTYAYCVRLLDRIENTPGYYQGIPVAMIGVVGDEAFPTTDLSADVTWPLIGLNGDWLLYTGDNYELFIKHYLGASLNILDTSYMGEIYYSKEYQEMDSFPGPNSTKVVDGILYVHTENPDRTIQFEN